MTYLEEVNLRELHSRATFDPDCITVSYCGQWGNDVYTAHSGAMLDYGDMWYLTTQYKYMSKLSNIHNNDGVCLTGLNASKLERCLELGCDWGHCFPVFDNFFDEVCGIEAMKSTASAGQRLGRKIVHGVMEETPYEDCYFDVVLSNHVLEHARSVEEILLEVYRITKHGGWSIHTLPCRVDKIVESESEIHKTVMDYTRWIDEFIHYSFTIQASYFSWNHNQEEFNIIARKPL